MVMVTIVSVITAVTDSDISHNMLVSRYVQHV